MTTIPTERFNKLNWFKPHNHHCTVAEKSNATTLLIGDSIVAGLSRYPNVWKKYFLRNSVNFGIGGDRVENVLWRSQNLPILPSLNKIIILCGINNINNDSPHDIADGVIETTSFFKQKYSTSLNICICGLLPRDESCSINRVIIDQVNDILQYKCVNEGFYFIDQSNGWTHDNGELNFKLYYKDSVHLIENGNAKLAMSLCSNRVLNNNINKNVSKQYNLYSNCFYFTLKEDEFPPLPDPAYLNYEQHKKPRIKPVFCNVHGSKSVCRPVPRKPDSSVCKPVPRKPVSSACKPAPCKSVSSACKPITHKPVSSVCNPVPRKPVSPHSKLITRKPSSFFCKPVSRKHVSSIFSSNVRCSKSVSFSNVRNCKPVSSSNVRNCKLASSSNVSPSKSVRSNTCNCSIKYKRNFLSLFLFVSALFWEFLLLGILVNNNFNF